MLRNTFFNDFLLFLLNIFFTNLFSKDIKKEQIIAPFYNYFAETKPTDEITSCPASLLMKSNTA